MSAQKNAPEFIIEDNLGIIIDAEPGKNTEFKYTVDDNSEVSKVYFVVSKTADADRRSVISAVEAKDKSFKADGKNHIMFDASLEDIHGNKLLVLKDSISIGIKYPESVAKKYSDYNFALYHIKNGAAENVPIRTKSDGIWFSADDFSPFMLTYEAKVSGGSNSGSAGKDDKTPDTGDHAQNNLAGVCLAVNLMLISAAAIYFITQKQQERAIAAAIAAFAANHLQGSAVSGADLETAADSARDGAESFDSGFADDFETVHNFDSTDDFGAADEFDSL